MGLGARIRDARQQLGFTQRQLATRSGLTQATISRIEGGRVKEVGVSALQQLALALSVSMDDLAGRSVDPTSRSSGDQYLGQILQLYARLDRPARQQALEYLRFLAQQHPSSRRRSAVK